MHIQHPKIPTIYNVLEYLWMCTRWGSVSNKNIPPSFEFPTKLVMESILYIGCNGEIGDFDDFMMVLDDDGDDMEENEDFYVWKA